MEMINDQGRVRQQSFGDRVGHAWRSRWDSLQLFTPAQFANLSGLPFPAPPETYPGKDDVADYLELYAKELQLPIVSGVSVTSLTRSRDRGFIAQVDAETLQARQVVVATGPFHVPFVPPIAKGLDPAIHQLHSSDYQRPRDIPPGRVQVVGAANSGCQIAEELAATPSVVLSSGQRIPTHSAAAAGTRRVVVGQRGAAGQGHRGVEAAGDRPGRPDPLVTDH